ncbi:MAG TPA: nucleotidyltransferase [Bacteroidota bacterium]
MPDRRVTPFEHVIALVDEICASNNLGYAIIGGIAATVYGSGRTTIDVDLIVQTDISALDLVYKAFASDFVPLKEKPLEFFRQYFVLPVIHKALHVKLDVSAALSGFEQTALKRAKRLPFGSVSAVFCSPEDLILFKLVANRDRDLVDVKDIVARNKQRLDLAYLRTTAAQFREVERSDIQETLETFLR